MWQEVKQLMRHSKKFIFFILIAGLLEFSLRGVIQQIFPETWYLRTFLTWRQLENTRNFIHGRLFIRPDQKMGWRNQEGFVKGKLSFDNFGAREIISSHENMTIKHKIMLIGDSRLCGCSDIANEETLGQFLESRDTHVLNFGTLYFSLDQSYLLLSDAIKQISPRAAIIGVGSRNTLWLNTIFLPFADEKIDIALIKPRFQLEKNSLVLVEPNVVDFLEALPNSIEPLAFFRRYDERYDRFENYKRNEFPPLLGIIHFLQKKFKDITASTDSQDQIFYCRQLANAQIAKHLIKSMNTMALEWDVQLIFLLLPEKQEMMNWENCRALKELKEIIQSITDNFIDAGAVFSQANLPADQIFLDNFYYTPRAHKILAEELKRRLEPVVRTKPAR